MGRAAGSSRDPLKKLLDAVSEAAGGTGGLSLRQTCWQGRFVVLVLGCFGTFSCSPNALEPRRALPGEAPRTAEVRAFEGWEYRPEYSVAPAFELDVGAEGVLAFDALGGRSLVQGERVERGRIAPEPLSGSIAWGNQLYALGHSGRVYKASGPLAPWTLDVSPQRLFVDSVVVKETGEFLGLSPEGELWSSRDRGHDWRRDPAPYFFTDLRVVRSEIRLSVVPEAHFSRGLDGKLELIAETTGGFEKEAATASTAHRAHQGDPSAPGSPAAPRRFLRPEEVRRGTGQVSPEGRAVAFVEETPSLFRLWRGQIDGPLQKTGLSLPCAPKLVALGAERIFAVCDASAKKALEEFVIYESSSSADGFREVGAGLRGASEHLKVRASKGAVAWSGVCPPGENEAGCEPRGLVLLAGASAVQLPMAEGGLPFDFAFGMDGALWAASLRGRDQHLILYRASWPLNPDPHSLPPSPLPVERIELQTVDLTALSPHFPPGATSASLLPGTGDQMGLVVRTAEAATVASFDPLLRVTGFGDLPESAATVGGLGDRFLAVDGRGGRLFESLDGGLSWAQSRIPELPSTAQSSAAILCASAGCLVGEELFRAGFGERQQESVTRSQRADAEQAATQKPPIECRVDQGSPVFLRGANSRPTAHDAARGDVFWSQVAQNPSDASAWVYHAQYGKDALERVTLFDRVRAPKEHAVAVSEQVEGSAALRFRTTKGTGAALVFDRIEVAWDNRIVDRVCRGILPFELQGSLLDLEAQAQSAARARPSILSISGDTLYLELAARTSKVGPLFAIEGCGQSSRILAFPEAVDPALRERELVRVHDQDHFLRLAPDGWVVSSSTVGGASRVMRLAGARGRRDLFFSTNLGYRGMEPRFTIVIAEGDGQFWRGQSLPIQGIAGPLPPLSEREPLLSDAREPLRPCTPEERRTTTRVISPAFPRGERSVVVRAANEVIPLTVGRAVVQGTFENPCVAALEAVSGSAGLTTSSGDAEYGALVDLTAGAVSWLFEEKKVGSGLGLSALPIDCRLVHAESSKAEDSGAPEDDKRDPH